MEHSTEPTTSASLETEQLNKIRTLLFGEQIHAQNQRLEQLEHQVDKNHAEIRTQLTQQIEGLEQRLTQQLTTLSQRLEESATGLSSRVETVNQALQSDLQQQTRSLKSELENHVGEVIEGLKTQIKTQKSNDEAQSAHLSTLFGEISRKLSNTD